MLFSVFILATSYPTVWYNCAEIYSELVIIPDKLCLLLSVCVLDVNQLICDSKPKNINIESTHRLAVNFMQLAITERSLSLLPVTVIGGLTGANEVTCFALQ